MSHCPWHLDVHAGFTLMPLTTSCWSPRLCMRRSTVERLLLCPPKVSWGPAERCHWYHQCTGQQLCVATPAARPPAAQPTSRPDCASCFHWHKMLSASCRVGSSQCLGARQRPAQHNFSGRCMGMGWRQQNTSVPWRQRNHEWALAAPRASS